MGIINEDSVIERALVLSRQDSIQLAQPSLVKLQVLGKLSPTIKLKLVYLLGVTPDFRI